MENIGFVLWMVLYPIGSAVTSYIGCKERKIEGKKPFDSSVTGLTAIVNIAVWIGVGKALFNC